jgi:1,2-phenylacetyl-CoA epoxidase PaaB subunit
MGSDSHQGDTRSFVGSVHAPDKATALKAAITQFNIRCEDQSRLLIRPR